MRNEKEMFDLILSVAKQDERIRAVYMNGSRTNPNVPKDIFQDYDIVFVVTETNSFINNERWIDVFGKLLIKQEPDKNDKMIGRKVNFERSYMYLMLFDDGNRIDLRLLSKDALLDEYLNDKLTVPLMDKDGCLPEIPPATDADYHVKRPNEALFYSSCNEFWWCLQNVAKGIWRDELPYAMQMYELIIRGKLDEMASWWIGMKHDFQVSSGKMGKYFKGFLPSNYWEMYKNTYSDSDYENMWDSIFTACELFRSLAHEVAESLSFKYPMEEDEGMMAYLKQVKSLSPEAEGVF